MPSLRLPDHHWYDSIAFRAPIGIAPIALAVVVARGCSTAGGFVFRTVAAVWALQQTNSALLTGLIIVLPGIAGMLCRGRINGILRLDPVKLLVPIELFRALLFLLLPLAQAWGVVIFVMVVAGALQAIYEAAFSGMIQQRFDRAHFRQINGLVRLAMFGGTLVALVGVALLHLTVADAAMLDGLTLVLSAASCALTGLLAIQPPAAQAPSEALAPAA